MSALRKLYNEQIVPIMIVVWFIFISLSFVAGIVGVAYTVNQAMR